MTSDTETSSFLPVGPAAAILGVPVAWLRREAEAGRVPHLKAGDRMLFNPKATERALIERAGQAASTIGASRLNEKADT